MKLLLVLLFCVCSALSVVLFKYHFEQAGGSLSLRSFLSWLFSPTILLALLLGLACRFIFYLLFNYYPASVTQLIASLSLVFTVIACCLIFGESLTSQQVLGALLIVIGVALVGA